MQAVATAHPNVALIKYWGKRAAVGNLPATGSLSLATRRPRHRDTGALRGWPGKAIACCSTSAKTPRPGARHGLPGSAAQGGRREAWRRSRIPQRLSHRRRTGLVGIRLCRTGDGRSQRTRPATAAARLAEIARPVPAPQPDPCWVAWCCSKTVMQRPSASRLRRRPTGRWKSWWR